MAEYSEAAARKIAGNIKVWQAQIAELQEAIDNAKSTLAQWYPTGEISREGKYDINVYVSKRFNPALAKKVLTPEEWDSVKTETVTAASVKNKFGEDSPQYTNSQKVSDSGVTVVVDIRDEEED